MNQSGVLSVLSGIISRDLRLALRRRSDVAMAALFFVIVGSLFPLGVGPELKVLRIMAPGVLWVAALLSCLLSLHRLFAEDYVDGVLDYLLLSPHPLAVLVLGKAVVHWIVAGLPLVLLSPVLGVQYGLGGEALEVLVLSLGIGTPTLSLVGSLGAALTLGLRSGGFLISLLVLPLYIPVLIFGASAVANTEAGIGAEAELSMLGAFLMLALALVPWATAAALRIAVE